MKPLTNNKKTNRTTTEINALLYAPVLRYALRVRSSRGSDLCVEISVFASRLGD